MKLRPSSRRNTILRTIALAILALALILRPLAASLGELHEFAHNPTNQHQDIGDLPTKASITDGAKVASEGNNAEPLHLLLHFAHCCGHTAATPSEFHLQAFNSPPASRPTWQLQATVASARWTTPFRPPITV